MLRRKNSAWSAVYDRIEGATSHAWSGFPLSKPDASRLMWVIYERSYGIGTHLRQDKEFGLIEIERETLADHDIVWLRKMN